MSSGNRQQPRMARSRALARAAPHGPTLIGDANLDYPGALEPCAIADVTYFRGLKTIKTIKCAGRRRVTQECRCVTRSSACK